MSRIDYLGCSQFTWEFYEEQTRKTENACLTYNRTHVSEFPIRLDCNDERLSEKEVLINEAYRGVVTINGKDYDLYQQYYYDVYEIEVYAGLDPLGDIREWLMPAGLVTGVGGFIITAAAISNPVGLAAGVVLSVGGIVTTLAGEAKPTTSWLYLGRIYNYHLNSMVIKYRKELRE